MRTLIGFIFLSLLLASCSGKRANNDVTIALSLGNIASGVPLTGGVFIAGTNGVDKFSFGTTDPNNVNIALPNGNWTINALGWKSGTKPMEGTNVCGSASIDLNGGDTAVNLNLSTANCLNVSYASPEAFDAVGDGTFKYLNFKSCLTLAGVSVGSNQSCNNTSPDLFMGVSAGIKIVMRGKSNFGAPVGNLVSECIGVVGAGTILDSSEFTSNIRLPVNIGGTSIFPVEIQGYRSADCGAGSSDGGDDEGGYFFVNGFGGAPENHAHSQVYTAGTTINTVYWADNYVGYPDSTFRAASASFSPIITCNGGNNCFPGDLNIRDNHPTTNIKETIWDIVGPPNLVDMYDVDYTSVSSRTFEIGGGTGRMTITSDNPGEDFRIRFVDSQAGSCGDAMNPTPFHDNGNGEWEIDACTVATTTTIVNAINLSPSLSFSASLDAGPAVFGWDALSASKRTLFPLRKMEREQGILQEITQMLYGPMGAMLHKNGYTNPSSLCGVNNTISQTFLNENGVEESFSIEISGGSIVAPDYMNFSNGNAFDTRITFREPGGGAMAFEFDCAGTSGTGWFRADWSHPGEEEKFELFYFTDVAGKEAVEMISYDNEGATEVRRNWTYFQKEIDTVWRLFKTNTRIDNDNSYERIMARANVGGADLLHINQYYASSSATAHINFTTGALAGEVNYQYCTKPTTEVDQSLTTCSTPLPFIEPGVADIAPDGTDAYTTPTVWNLDFSTSDLDAKIPANFNSL